ASRGIPIWGDLSGANARGAAADAARERSRRDRALAALAEFMPSADDLAVTYGMEDAVGDTTAEGELSRDHLREWAGGGLTDADRAMRDEVGRSEGRAARADREASLSSLD